MKNSVDDATMLTNNTLDALLMSDGIFSKNELLEIVVNLAKSVKMTVPEMITKYKNGEFHGMLLSYRIRDIIWFIGEEHVVGVLGQITSITTKI